MDPHHLYGVEYMTCIGTVASAACCMQSEEVIRLLQCMGEMLAAYPAQLDPGFVPRLVGFWEQLFVWLHACRCVGQGAKRQGSREWVQPQMVGPHSGLVWLC
jgi:hypothetical protein